MMRPNYYFQSESPLEHLSKQEITEVISLYQRGRDIEQITQQFNIELGNHDFYDCIPYTPWMGCLCGAIIYFKFPPREVAINKNTFEFTCPTCGIDSITFKRDNDISDINNLL